VVVDTVELLTRIYLNQGRTKEALGIAEGGEVALPGDKRILENLGRVHLALNNKTVAKNLFRRISTDAGFDPDSLYRVSLLLEQAGDLKGAIWALQKAEQDKDASVKIRIRLAELLVQDGKPDKAIEQGNRIRQLYPKAPWGELLLGRLQLQLGNFDQALPHFEAAQALNAGPDAMVGIISAKIGLKQADQAFELAKAAKQKYPKDLRLRLMLAEQFLQFDQWAEAQSEYEFIIRQIPDEPVALNNLALVYGKAGDPRALETARKAVKLNQRSAFANDTLGWLLVQEKQYSEGLKYLRNAAALAPHNGEIRYHLAVALQGIGKREESARELEAALSEEGQHDWTADAKALRDHLL